MSLLSRRGLSKDERRNKTRYDLKIICPQPALRVRDFRPLPLLFRAAALWGHQV